MTPEEFRKAAAAAADWVATYWERIERFPVLAQVKPGDVRAGLPARAPEHGEPFDTVLADLDRIILPGITHWQAPGFYGFFPANASGPAALGDLISSGLGVQGMLWATSPACTELETHVLDWMIDLLALPDQFRSSGTGGGVIQDTASSASLCALLAARERASGGRSNRSGVSGTFVAYASTQAHSSIEKAAGIAGVGRENLRQVPVDETFAMRPDALEQAIAADRAAGKTPFFVTATVGTTSSTAMDPLRPISAICGRHGLWLHVDAAHAGSAAICPEFRRFHDGLEGADSYCFNPHKWLLTNFDCDCFYVANRSALLAAFAVLPEYLRAQTFDAGGAFDYRNWQIPLGRRFRALKLWFVIRHYGADGLRRHIRHTVGLAQEFAHWVEADERFVLAAPAPLNLVCFRHRAGDGATQQTLDRVNASGEAYLTHTRLADRLVIRMAIGSPRTERRHVERAWALIRKAAA
jgi:aromatic-L-amino-acid decarboxylase